MRRLVKKSFAVLSITALILAGCGKEDTQYGNEIGTVDGKINFNGGEPEITLSNIKSYVGEEIDFLSGIEVGNIDENKDMETWVDSSLVDIFTPGDYKATYTIKYNEKEYTKDIVVTIIAKENSGESNVADNDNSQETTVKNSENTPNTNGGQNVTNASGNKGEQAAANNSNGSGGQAATSSSNGSGGQIVTSNSNGSGGQNATNSSNGNGGQNTTYKPQATTRPDSTSQTTKKSQSTSQTTKKPQNTNQTTAKRQIVTSSGNVTTAYKELGYYSIELLSGKKVKLKGSTSKYIVSTHTDISYVTKNNSKYKVSKLIVNFNDGTSRVLETVEEKVQ